MSNPFDFAQRREPSGEHSRVSQSHELAEELQYAVVMRRGPLLEEATTAPGSRGCSLAQDAPGKPSPSLTPAFRRALQSIGGGAIKRGMVGNHSHLRSLGSAVAVSVGILALQADAFAWSSMPMQVNPLDRNDVGALFQTYYQQARAVPPTWTGSASGCAAGDTSVEFKQAQIGQINWNRAMAGAPAQVVFDSTNLAGAQQLGLMIAVNRALSHTPPASWLCYTAAGAEAAGASNIGFAQVSGGGTGALPAPGIVSGYMRDTGASNTAVGHRRWVLHPPTTQMTIGLAQATDSGLLTSGHNIRVIYSNWNDPWPTTRWGFVAWPPPGFVPWQEAHARWSLIVDDADFSAATVRVTYGAATVPTQIVHATGPAGPFFGGPAVVWEFTQLAGVAFDPLAPTAGGAFRQPDRDVTYTVRVDNVQVAGQGLRSFEYQVTVIDAATHETDFNLVFENGWWWNALQSGRGFFIEKQGNVLFIAGYLYSDDGRPRWLAATCVMDSASSCGGDLAEYTGGQSLTGPYQAPTSQPVGAVRLTFHSRTRATMQWPGGALEIERYTFGGNRFDGTTTGWWWNQVEPGSGWGFEIQGTTFFIAGYSYDNDGHPTWYLGTGSVTGGNVLTGRLQRYSGGQTLTGPYKPPSVVVQDAGPFSLRLTGAETAAFSVAGKERTLQRFLFGR